MKFKNPLAQTKLHRETLDRVLDSVFELLLYLACFFPFVQFVWWGSDTQPYSVFLSLFLMITYWIRNNVGEKKYMILAICCVGMGGFAIAGIFMNGFASAVRSYFSYLSLIVIPLAVFITAKKRGGLNETLMKICMWVWFIVGFVQKYYIPDFCHRFLSRHTTGGVRGAVSLATEPSAYGYMCLFMMLIVLQMKKHRLIYITMLLVQIVVFANSSVTLVYLAVYILAYMINELAYHKKFALLKTVGVAGVGLGSLLIIKAVVPETNRMGALVKYMFEHPERIIEDESIVMRVDAIKFGFESFIENYGMPHGMYTFKIMSGMGGLFYECGFIAFIILFAIGMLIWFGSHPKFRLMYVIGYMLIMFSSIPFSAPIMCFYLGVCFYRAWVYQQEKYKNIASLTESSEPAIWYRGKLYRKRVIEHESTMDM